MTVSPSSTMRRDLISAYAVTGARVLSWVIVSAVVYQKLGAAALALVTLVRATIGILSYTSLGLGPALVKKLAEMSGAVPTAKEVVIEAMEIDRAEPPAVLPYETPRPPPRGPEGIVTTYKTATSLVSIAAAVAFIFTVLYAVFFDTLSGQSGVHHVAQSLAVTFGLGIVFRLASEAESGFLQARDRIALDNFFLACAELIWAALTLAAARSWVTSRIENVSDVGASFAASALALLGARVFAGRTEAATIAAQPGHFVWSIARDLLTFGSLIVIAQVADFLYAPTDCILISHLIGNNAVAWYSPAIQIDAGLLMLVSGLAAVLYPKSALAHAGGDSEAVRRYYFRGTLASIALLVPAAVLVWALSPWIFQLWFHDTMPLTRAILPLILIHTVVGGSSAVGRSVLLAVGKIKPFTIAVLIAGVSNVVLSFVFVRYGGLGLKGIVLGTIVAVVARCAIWMPWYVMRSVRRDEVRA